jgi:hypothetical protein
MDRAHSTNDEEEWWFVFSEKVRERDHYDDQDISWWIILRWILERYNGVVWNGLVWLRIGTRGGFL